jgi:hypothetical protein
MKRNLVYALAAIAISGCASDSVTPAGKLPPITDPAEAGDVVLIRPRAFIADETSFYINVNREDIAPIGSGRHTRLKLPAGEHRVAIRCYSNLSGWQETAITQRVVAGQAAYLAIAPHKDCVSVEPVSESEGSKLLARTVFVKVLH